MVPKIGAFSDAIVKREADATAISGRPQSSMHMGIRFDSHERGASRQIPQVGAHAGTKLDDLGGQLAKDPTLMRAQVPLQVRAHQAEEPEAPLGALFENFVAMEIRKQLPLTTSDPRLFHFRDRDGTEVDLVLQTRRGQVGGIEVKASATVIGSDFKGLRFLQSKLGDKFAGGVVLYAGTEIVPFGTNLWAVPISVIWS